VLVESTNNLRLARARAGRLVAILCGAAFLAGCISAPRYELVDLGTLPGDATSEPAGINDAGVVVGFSSGPSGERAFVWDAVSGMREVGDLPGGTVSSRASAINNAGQIVGRSTTWNDAPHAFLFTPGQGMRDLGDLAGGVDYSWASGINARGQVVGSSNGPNQWTAFVWDATNGMRDLGILDAKEAIAINDFGKVTGSLFDGGTFAFVYDTQTQVLRKVGQNSPDGRMTAGRAINRFGDVAGVGARWLTPTLLSNIQVAFANRGGVTTTLDDVSGRSPGLSDSAANGINESKDVVGWTSAPSGQRAMIWGWTFASADLNSRVLPCDPLGNSVVLTDARAINNRGDVAAIGTVNGTYRAFLARNITFLKTCPRPLRGRPLARP